MTERVKYGGELPGDPIYYNPDHRPFVPVVGGAAPFCSCGWRSAEARRVHGRPFKETR